MYFVAGEDERDCKDGELSDEDKLALRGRFVEDVIDPAREVIRGHTSASRRTRFTRFFLFPTSSFISEICQVLCSEPFTYCRHTARLRMPPHRRHWVKTIASYYSRARSNTTCTSFDCDGFIFSKVNLSMYQCSENEDEL